MRIGLGPALGRVVQDPRQGDRTRVILFTPTRGCAETLCGIVSGQLFGLLSSRLCTVFLFYARSLRRHATRTLVVLRQGWQGGDGERGAAAMRQLAPSTAFHDPS